MRKTIISAGEIINDILVNDENVKSITMKVYPVATDTAILPYIIYRRTNIQQAAVKCNTGADTATMELSCYARTYFEGVILAEAVYEALDGAQKNKNGMILRSCMLVEASEDWIDDAYLQQLIFNIKI